MAKTERPTDRGTDRTGRPLEIPLNEEPPHELDFNRGDERRGRAGDLRPRADVEDEFPPGRERIAGMTEGETAEGEVTADDLAPV